MPRLFTFALVTPVCLAMVTQSHAREIFPLKYEELFKRAESVVIAHAVSTADADKDAKDGEKEYRIGVLTTFEVIHVVKGESPDRLSDLLRFGMRGRDPR